MTEKSIGLLYSPLLGLHTGSAEVKDSHPLCFTIEETRMALGYAGFLLLIFAQTAIGTVIENESSCLCAFPAFLLEGGIFLSCEKMKLQNGKACPFYRTSLKHS